MVFGFNVTNIGYQSEVLHHYSTKNEKKERGVESKTSKLARDKSSQPENVSSDKSLLQHAITFISEKLASMSRKIKGVWGRIQNQIEDHEINTKAAIKDSEGKPVSVGRNSIYEMLTSSDSLNHLQKIEGTNLEIADSMKADFGRSSFIYKLDGKMKAHVKEGEEPDKKARDFIGTLKDNGWTDTAIANLSRFCYQGLSRDLCEYAALNIYKFEENYMGIGLNRPSLPLIYTIEENKKTGEIIVKFEGLMDINKIGKNGPETEGCVKGQREIKFTRGALDKDIKTIDDLQVDVTDTLSDMVKFREGRDLEKETKRAIGILGF